MTPDTLTSVLKAQMLNLDPSIDFEKSNGFELYQDILQEVNQNSPIESFRIGINLSSEDTGEELNSNITLVKFSDDLSNRRQLIITGYAFRQIEEDIMAINFVQPDLLMISLDY